MGFSTKSTTVLLLLLSLGVGADAKQRTGVRGTVDEAEQRNLVQDDENFWSRLVQEVASNSFPTPAPTQLELCNVTVTISCKDEDGTECKDIAPPAASCTVGGPISTLKWRYNPCVCPDAMNNQDDVTCTDSSDFPDGPVNIECVPVLLGAQPLNIEPSTVEPGDTFVITGSGELPAEILCTLSDGGTTIQEFTFFTQGAALDLGNKFGSFELVSCEDEGGNGPTCEELLCYSYDIVNIGEFAMDLSQLNRTQEGVVTSIADKIPDDKVNLQPGDSVVVEDKILTDICTGETITTVVEVEGNPASGVVCQDEDTYEFTVTSDPTEAPTKPPTPEPTPGPSPAPTPEPTPGPSPEPTPEPTPGPSPEPTPGPSPAPTPEPTPGPSPEPTPGPSPAPTPEPTPGPSPEPTPGPSPAPTPEPTPGPSPEPTPGPTPAPTVSPTPEPTPGPTPEPTPGPSPEPTPGPSPEPTPGPSPEPTPEPTPGPSPEPTPGPTPAPTTMAPTVAPTPCTTELSVECTNCDTITTNPRDCEERPIQLTMLFTGNTCEEAVAEGFQGGQGEDGKYLCTDAPGGGEFLQGLVRGDTAYVVVTAQKDEGVIYYTGPVSLGESFILENADMSRFEADQVVTVYSSGDAALGADQDVANLIQDVSYHSSCSQNLGLFYQFGANQVIGWIEDGGEVVNAFTNNEQSTPVNIEIPIGNDSGGTITSLIIIVQACDLQGNCEDDFFDLTEQVAGQELQPGETLEVVFNPELNLAIEKEYSYLVSITTVTADGLTCTGTGFDTFTAGGFDESDLGNGDDETDDEGGEDDKDDKDDKMRD